MVQFIQGFWVLLIVFFLLFKFRIGLAFYLAYLILVPYMNINFWGFNFQWNLINTLLLLCFIYTFKTKKYTIDYTPFLPFIIYFSVSLLLMLFQTDTPFSFEISTWRKKIFITQLFPFILWNQIKVDYKSFFLYKKVLLICISLVVLYGLLLAAIPGNNPYIGLISIANGSTFDDEYALADGGGRLFGRISSVFTHPMRFGFFLGVAMIYVYNLYIKYTGTDKMKFFLLSLILLIGVSFVTCGIRSVLGGFFVTFIFYLLQVRQFKKIFLSIVFFLILWLIIKSIPDLMGYFSSMVSYESSSSEVRGSSIEQRMQQLNGCFDEVKNCFIQGKGFEWHKYDFYVRGYHPVILCFESLIFIILCDSGLLGFFLWAYMAFILFRYNKKICGNITQRSVLNALFVFYISYSCVTGECGFLINFMIFYVMMIGEIYTNKQTLFP